MARAVAVTGGTGLIGRRLIDALLARGDEVVALSRNAPRRELPAEVEQRSWSSEEPEADLQGVDAVVHLAGEPVAAGRWTPERKRAIEESRVAGTRSIAAGIRAAHPRVRVFVSASGIDVYGDTGEATIDERTPEGEGFLARVGRRWEAEALRARQQGVRVVTLRTGMVLAREGGALPRLLRVARLGLFGPMGGGRQYWPWIHVEDEIGLILHALDEAAIDGPMIAAAPNPVRQRDFARALGRALRRPAFAPAPRFALRAAVGEMADVLLASHRAMPRVAIETGYAFRHPEIDAALADLLAPAR